MQKKIMHRRFFDGVVLRSNIFNRIYLIEGAVGAGKYLNRDSYRKMFIGDYLY